MSTLVSIKQDEQLIGVLSDMVQVYEQLFVDKMQVTRDNVLGSRQYIEGIKDLYNEVRRAYGEEILQLMRKQVRLPWLHELITRDTEVAVFITGSGKIGSAEINQRVIVHFREFIENHDCDIVVVGEWGYTQLHDSYRSRKIYFYAVKDGEDELQAMRNMFEVLQKYAKVRIFYGRYVNLVNQSEGEVVLGPDQPINSQPSNDTIPKYTYEPGLKELVDFFTNEIFTSVFLQTKDEAYLSQLGSRITSMETALSNIDKQRFSLLLKRRRLIKRKKNRKLMQVMTGMSFWNIRR